MIAEDDEICLVCVGDRKGPNEFKYWTWYAPAHQLKEKHAYLNKLRYKGSGFGFAYYYSNNKIWFRTEKHLTMWLLQFA